jgi:selenide,water dikinase
MARASGVTLTIDAGRVPVFDRVLHIAVQNRSGGLGSNQEHFASGVHVEPGVDENRQLLLYDPQTSGGLLIAASADAAQAVGARLHGAGVHAEPVGSVRLAIPGVHIVVRP